MGTRRYRQHSAADKVAILRRVAGDLGVVLIRLAVALLPVEVLAGAQAEPAEKPPSRQLRLGTPLADKVDHGIPCVVGNPGAAAQGSPSSFFCFTNSSVTRAMTRSFCPRRCRRTSTVRASSRCSPPASFANAAAPFSKNCFCHV